MTTTGEDLAEIGRLLGFAARPRELPARSDIYASLVDRYLRDEQFALAANRVAAGAGVTLHVDPTVGVVAVAYGESPFRIPLAEFRRKTYANERAMLGIVVLSVARVAYPTTDRLDDDVRVATVTVASVVDYLNRLIERLTEAADNDPEAGEAQLVEVWRHWAQMRQHRFDAVRMSIKDKVGIVKRTCEYLEEQGLLQRRSTDDGGTYLATNRFRVAVTALVEDSDLYSDLVELLSDAAFEPADDPDPGISDAGGEGGP